jgi:hypothetical protein
MHDKYETIKRQVEALAKIINAPEYLLPTYGNSIEAHPNITLNEAGLYSYEAQERGEQLIMIEAIDTDHLLYLVFRDISYRMALAYAAEKSATDTDSRRIRFDHQLELLGRLNKDWGEKEKQYQASINRQFPFDDVESMRQHYLRELMGSGFLYQEAMEKVNQKYR